MKSALEDCRTLLALLSLPRVGRVTARRIASALQEVPRSSGDLLALIKEVAPSVPRMPKVADDDVVAALEDADRQLDECRVAGVVPIACGDERFPHRFRTIDDSPVVLFVKARAMPDWNAAAIAIIGTREPTAFGVKAAHRIATRVAEAGICVVSGLALGCDADAHRGCLEAHGVTIAVMAHGLDSVSPTSNAGLAEAILESGGALVSEYALGVAARPNYFIERDRLQSGLSDAVIVIETDVEGGTMHTVGYAGKQGRPVAAIFHPEALRHEPKCRGNQKLIAEGKAAPLSDAASLTAFLAAHCRRVQDGGTEGSGSVSSSIASAKTGVKRGVDRLAPRNQDQNQSDTLFG